MQKTEVSFENCHVEWKETAAPQLSDRIDVWKLHTDLDSSLIDFLKTLLSPAESKKSERFYRDEDRKCYIVRQGALHLLLGKYAGIPPENVAFSPGKNEKPAMDHPNRIHFNVSHSHNRILIAVSNTEVGIDIERINTGFPYEEVLSQSFENHEIEKIKTSVNPREQFFSFWTRKESLLKATSKGIDDELPHIPCMDGRHQVQTSVLESADQWKVCTFDVEDDYRGSVAFAADRQPQFFSLEVEKLL